MSVFYDTIRVHLNLTAYGDALLYGGTESNGPFPAFNLKQNLFAWHEPSFYGTELEIHQGDDIEVVVLPDKYVIPFFAKGKLLAHIEWLWGEEAERLRQFAPALWQCIETGNYHPDFAAFQRGDGLVWTWDNDAAVSENITLPRTTQLDESFSSGLQAAFSAAVTDRYYSTEAAAADLRRDFPLLFAKDHSTASGLDERGWLRAIGWEADQAPFRPLLQLLEPEPEQPDSFWQLKLVLQDKQELARTVPVRLSSTGQAAGAWPDNWSAAVRERSASWLQHLRTCLPAERFAGDDDDLLHCPLENDAAWQFLMTDSQRLLEAGWQVLLPAWWETVSRKKPRLRAKVKSEAGQAGRSLFGLDALVEFDWRIAIGDTNLTEEEFAELAARNERLVHFRGKWIALDPSLLGQIRSMMANMDKSRGLSFQDVLELHLLAADGGQSDSTEQDTEEQTRIQLEVELNAHLLKLIGQLGQQTELPSADVPSDLHAELRSYQHDGYSWLVFLRRFGLGACLADDMGLGKTVQLIAYLLHLKAQTALDAQRTPSLIICPTSVIGNWQKELQRFAPSLQLVTHYGNKRLGGEAFHAAMRGADVMLTSYATATLDQETLGEVTWATICLDEAQNIKNAQTKQSAAVRSFSAQHRIALTGTPIENRLSELWAIYDFINPGFLGSAHGFQKRFGQAVEKERDAGKTADLQKLVRPFMLRRKKTDPNIQLDLPDKNEMKTYIHLTPEQGALYNQAVNQLLERMKKLEGIERKGAILSALTQLKQICNHPMLLTKESVAELHKAAGEQPDYELLISRSAKLERLLAMVRELRDEGERCLIFTQYIGMGQLLQFVLRQELAEPVIYLNGSTPKPARDNMIAQFQSNSLPPEEQPHVFILSIKAGGVGLNLTAANHVFHFDRWWNPAVENQATDRAYRIGQTRDVQVHKFISLGTLEERIDEMLESKQQLSDNIISSSEGWITELSNDALKELFTLRQEWDGS
ncbi:DEAD/DEAH box helicase [Paenibacillaceae bacterium]|nr:DEAD/DEAH box helicase [Paenibacillaceae bacterium]